MTRQRRREKTRRINATKRMIRAWIRVRLAWDDLLTYPTKTQWEMAT